MQSFVRKFVFNFFILNYYLFVKKFILVFIFCFICSCLVFAGRKKTVLVVSTDFQGVEDSFDRDFISKRISSILSLNFLLNHRKNTSILNDDSKIKKLYVEFLQSELDKSYLTKIGNETNSEEICFSELRKNKNTYVYSIRLFNLEQNKEIAFIESSAKTNLDDIYENDNNAVQEVVQKIKYETLTKDENVSSKEEAEVIAETKTESDIKKEPENSSSEKTNSDNSESSILNSITLHFGTGVNTEKNGLVDFGIHFPFMEWMFLYLDLGFSPCFEEFDKISDYKMYPTAFAGLGLNKKFEIIPINIYGLCAIGVISYEGSLWQSILASALELIVNSDENKKEWESTGSYSKKFADLRLAAGVEINFTKSLGIYSQVNFDDVFDTTNNIGWNKSLTIGLSYTF